MVQQKELLSQRGREFEDILHRHCAKFPRRLDFSYLPVRGLGSMGCFTKDDITREWQEHFPSNAEPQEEEGSQAIKRRLTGSRFRHKILSGAGPFRAHQFTLSAVEFGVADSHIVHPKFASVADLQLSLFSRWNQVKNKGPVVMSLGEAVKKNLSQVHSETSGYYLAQAHQFLVAMGADPAQLQFRQYRFDEEAKSELEVWTTEYRGSSHWISCLYTVVLVRFNFEYDRAVIDGANGSGQLVGGRDGRLVPTHESHERLKASVRPRAKHRQPRLEFGMAAILNCDMAMRGVLLPPPE